MLFGADPKIVYSVYDSLINRIEIHYICRCPVYEQSFKGAKNTLRYLNLFGVNDTLKKRVPRSETLLVTKEGKITFCTI